jgi:hypothetical protein
MAGSLELSDEPSCSGTMELVKFMAAVQRLLCALIEHGKTRGLTVE